MLSRLALQSGQKSMPSLILIRQSGSSTTAPPISVTPTTPATSATPATSTPLESSERDLVNFPRPVNAIYPGKVRMGIFPDEWFTFFYPKTGVTGPYMFGTGLLTYLLSKEIWTIEHEFWTGLSLLTIIVYCVKKFGPGVASYLNDEVEKEEKEWADFRSSFIDDLKTSIEHEKDGQWRLNGQTMLYDAKRENIGLQLEAAYRQRLAQVHSAVKKKLDYQLETSNVKTRMEQRHMVNWIVENVRKSITPAQEAANLKQCFADLKALAAKA